MSDSSNSRRERDACQARLEMVEKQIERRGIRDPRILEAFRAVPRHQFCPSHTSLAAAYGDHPLDIGEGQTISQPLIVAEMTEQLQPGPESRILEIGTGSGYQGAILAHVAGEVHTVERIPRLAEKARHCFAELGLTNIFVHVGDGTRGWPDAAPYDGIIITAAAPEIPAPLREQLAVGGRLVAPVGSRQCQELVVCVREGEQRFSTRQRGGCRFVPLLGDFGWPE